MALNCWEQKEDSSGLVNLIKIKVNVFFVSADFMTTVKSQNKVLKEWLHRRILPKVITQNCNALSIVM